MHTHIASPNPLPRSALPAATVAAPLDNGLSFGGCGIGTSRTTLSSVLPFGKVKIII